MEKFKKPLLIFIGLLLLVAIGAAFIFWDYRIAKVSPKNPKVELALIAEGLGNPTAIVANGISDSKDLFVVDRVGTVKVLNSENQNTPVYTFLDISEKVQAEGEMGLLGIAFHPKFSENGFFFVNYVDRERNTIISRFSTERQENVLVADKLSEKVLINTPQPYSNHNGGDLQFGKDGFLYIALGDGGSGGDPQNRAQNLNTLLGKMLRIDVDGGDPYLIPEENPFVGVSGARGEIWSYGLRNPWRFSFDRETENMWIADVGQGDIEEINLEPKGKKGLNYGWRCYEGSKEYNTEGCGDKELYTPPLIEYDHTESRCSVTGGFVYRGKNYPNLNGKYFYGDFCGGQVYTAEQKDGKWSPELVLTTDHQISTFGQGNDGELYLADFDSGDIYQLTDSSL